MKILVTGGSGFVGYRLCEKFISAGHEVDFTYHLHACKIEGAQGHMADLSEKESAPALEEKHYEMIIHSAALANVDFCEKNPQVAHKQNVVGTRNALLLAKKCGARFLYISTSHVFPGGSKAYTENDVPRLEDIKYIYAKTKLQGELDTLSSGLHHLILRIDQPYYWAKEWQKDNTVTRTLKKLKNGEKITEVEDWLNCPTFLPSFCSLALALAKKGPEGAFNAAGPEYLSRFSWAKKTAAVFDYGNEGIVPITASSLNLPVERPNVNLDSSRAYKLAGIENAGIDAGLAQMKKEQGKRTN